MTTRTTKAQAVEVLKLITAGHAHRAYFIKADVVANGDDYGVDVRVNREAWEASGEKAIPNLNRVPVCLLLCG